MYKIICDNEVLYSPLMDNYSILSAVLKSEVNKAGTLEMALPFNNSAYNNLNLRKSCVKVYDGDELIFEGYPYEPSRNLYGDLDVLCVGVLSFLNDSVQLPFPEGIRSITEMFSSALEYHNGQVEEHKRFRLGRITVTSPDTQDKIVAKSDKPMSTLEYFNTFLARPLGGYLNIRYEGNIRYLDYLSTMDVIGSQNVKQSLNLIDVDDKVTSSALATVIYPFGAIIRDEFGHDTGERVSIESVNNGKYYIENTEAIADKGRIAKAVVYDNLTLPEQLVAEATKDLRNSLLSRSIEISAADLSKAGYPVGRFKLGENIQVKIDNLGLDMEMFIRKLSVDLLHPESSKLVVGSDIEDFSTMFTNYEAPKGEAGPAGVSLKSITHYYKLSETVPAIDDTWTTIEPAYDGNPANSLWVAERVEYTNGTIKWSSVSRSSSYEASKEAILRAESLEDITEAQQNSINSLNKQTGAMNEQLQSLQGIIEAYKSWVEIVMEDTVDRKAGIYIKQNGVDRLAIVAEKIQFSEQDGTKTTYIANRKMISENVDVNNITFKSRGTVRKFKMVAENNDHLRLTVE